MARPVVLGANLTPGDPALGANRDRIRSSSPLQSAPLIMPSTIPKLNSGSVRIEPDIPMVAGSYGTTTVTYAHRGDALRQGASVTIFTESDSDAGRPQLTIPGLEGYTTATVPVGCRVSLQTLGMGTTVKATVVRGELRDGDELTVVFGGNAPTLASSDSGFPRATAARWATA